MKKPLGLVLLLLLFLNVQGVARDRFILTLYGDFLHMAANSFTDQAAKNKIFFEAKAAVAVSGNFYAWASHGYFPLRDTWTGWSSKAVFDKDVSTDRKLAKRIIGGGCGYFAGYFEPGQIAIRLELGVCSITNDIDSTVRYTETSNLLRTDSAKQSGIGIKGGLAVTYGLYKNIFAEVNANYLYASDTIDGVRSNLGGFQAALGLGIQF